MRIIQHEKRKHPACTSSRMICFFEPRLEGCSVKSVALLEVMMYPASLFLQGKKTSA